jgi:hypothetical protein
VINSICHHRMRLGGVREAREREEEGEERCIG